MSSGMNESAEESDLLCFSSPGCRGQYTRSQALQDILTKYDFAAVENADDLVSGSPVGLDLQKF